MIQQIAYGQLRLVETGKSEYRVVIPSQPSKQDEKAAEVLTKYIARISGCVLPVLKDSEGMQAKEICLGETNRKGPAEIPRNGSFLIETKDEHLLIRGDGKGVLYGVYHVLDKYLGCRKFSADLSYVPANKDISLPKIKELQAPQFRFRQVYYPDQYDEEFRDWHKLQLLEEEWGLWGHSYDKLLPARQYFQEHPEYFGLVNGERKALQLCLSNPEVLRIVTENLRERIVAQPEKKIWSVAQNDGFGYCTCSRCAAYDQKHGGPQASVLHFANQVAAKFPDYTISTLAYLYSKKAPIGLRAAKNVSVMLSTIDQNRARSIASNPAATSFRNEAKSWKIAAPNLMVWDYVVQFTNYLSPFPNLGTVEPNLNYFGDVGFTGAFLQGTETGLGEFSALKAYLLAKLSWEPGLDIAMLKREFMQAYYGKAAQPLQMYIQALEKQLLASRRFLDIYGDPVAEWNTWLSPGHMVVYDEMMEKAESAVGMKEPFRSHVDRERLALEYAFLQQARFYGIERHGAFVKDGDSWAPKAGFEQKVQRFILAARKAGIKELAEGGPSLSEYEQEWSDILKKGPLLHKALGKKVKIIKSYNPEYPSKGARTLTDGSVGYNNFQYNYLGWHGDDMEVEIDLGSVQEFSVVSAGFLEDQRHWAFLPRKVALELSDDGRVFRKAGADYVAPYLEELYEKETHRIRIELAAGTKARYIRLKAKNLEKLPEWRDLPNRKSWIFCDEISVD